MTFSIISIVNTSYLTTFHLSCISEYFPNLTIDLPSEFREGERFTFTCISFNVVPASVFAYGELALIIEF